MELTKTRFSTRDLTYIAAFVALMAVCAWIAIPTAIPFTLQTMGVFLAAGVLGGRRGTVAVTAYVVLGAVGAPVFASFTGGIGVLLRNTGGYLIGFIFSALVMWGAERLFGKSLPVLGASMVLGLAVCYAFGTAWFQYIYIRDVGPVGLAAVLGWCVVPYIIPDLVKIAAALSLTAVLRPHVR